MLFLTGILDGLDLPFRPQFDTAGEGVDFLDA
jgi:hypothetical protein